MKNSFIFIFVVSTFLLFSSASFASKTEENKLKQDFQALIDKHKGKTIYLDFWASWCMPCRQSFPWLNNIQTKYQSQGLVVLSVNVDHRQKNAENFLKEIPANFSIFYDAKGIIAREMKVRGMPYSFIINKKGDVVSQHSGFNDQKKIAYEEEIKALIAE